jgi:hypothetical protein
MISLGPLTGSLNNSHVKLSTGFFNLLQTLIHTIYRQCNTNRNTGLVRIVGKQSRTQEVLRRDFDETAVAATVGKEEDSLVRHGFGVSGVPTEDLEPGESAYFCWAYVTTSRPRYTLGVHDLKMRISGGQRKLGR